MLRFWTAFVLRACWLVCESGKLHMLDRPTALWQCTTTVMLVQSRAASAASAGRATTQPLHPCSRQDRGGGEGCICDAPRCQTAPRLRGIHQRCAQPKWRRHCPKPCHSLHRGFASCRSYVVTEHQTGCCQASADASLGKKRKTPGHTPPKRVKAARMATDVSGESMSVPGAGAMAAAPAALLPRAGVVARRVTCRAALRTTKRVLLSRFLGSTAP